jgi:hypothetical protein
LAAASRAAASQRLQRNRSPRLRLRQQWPQRPQTRQFGSSGVRIVTWEALPASILSSTSTE